MRKSYLVISGIVVIVGIVTWLGMQNYHLRQQDQFQCATAAAANFQSFSADNPFHAQLSYTDHWNAAMGKCFIVTEADTELATSTITAVSINDALENKFYGLMNTINGAFNSCEIFPSGSVNVTGGDVSQPCTSENEFNAYEHSLMSN